jgi:hypothetical protein
VDSRDCRGIARTSRGRRPAGRSRRSVASAQRSAQQEQRKPQRFVSWGWNPGVTFPFRSWSESERQEALRAHLPRGAPLITAGKWPLWASGRRSAESTVLANAHARQASRGTVSNDRTSAYHLRHILAGRGCWTGRSVDGSDLGKACVFGEKRLCDREVNTAPAGFTGTVGNYAVANVHAAPALRARGRTSGATTAEDDGRRHSDLGTRTQCPHAILHIYVGPFPGTCPARSRSLYPFSAPPTTERRSSSRVPDARRSRDG